MIRISEELLRAIKLEGEKNYPDECCGFLVGQIGPEGEKHAEEIWRVANASILEEMYHRFFIPAEAMLDAERKARRQGREIIGFYHSHPDCDAVPSEFDRKNALPVYSYIITAVLKKNALDIRSWELKQEKEAFRFCPEIIVKGEDTWQ